MGLSLASSRQSLFVATGLLVVILFFTLARTTRPTQVTQTPVDQSQTKIPTGPPQRPASRKIWQTARQDVFELEDDIKANTKRWISMNPTWRYELLTDYSMDTYVREAFSHRSDIIDVFTSLTDSILRADFVRYLVLLGDGGVYSDLDTECLKPIEEWLPAVSFSMSSLAPLEDLAVVGIEYDTFGLGHVGALLDLQLVNWTLMSRRSNHGLFSALANRVVSGLTELARNQSVGIPDIQANFNDVLATTGPAALTLATWDYLTQATGSDFTWKNVTGITQPLLVHDVLIMPVTSFGNGQSHSHAGTPDDEAALVHHQFKGGWKTGGHSFKHVDVANARR